MNQKQLTDVASAVMVMMREDYPDRENRMDSVAKVVMILSNCTWPEAQEIARMAADHADALFNNRSAQ